MHNGFNNIEFACMVELSDKQISILKKNAPLKIGHCICFIRKSKNITQTELANAIGKDRQYIHKIEKGKVAINITTLHILLNALELNFKEFFECFENQSI